MDRIAIIVARNAWYVLKPLYCECLTVQRLGIEPKMNARTVALIFGKFLYLFLASLILGLVLGLFSALLLKKYNVSQTPQVLLLTALSTAAQHQSHARASCEDKVQAVGMHSRAISVFVGGRIVLSGSACLPAAHPATARALHSTIVCALSAA